MLSQSRSKRRIIALVAGACLALAGCMDAPNEPDPAPVGTGEPTPAPTNETQVLLLSGDGQAWFVAAEAESDTTGSGYVGPDETRALKTSVTIDGEKGGTVACGRFSLSFPPGAFMGSATIDMTVPDSLAMLCDMDIQPGTLNQFRLPVDLCLDLGGLNVSAAEVTILWYDPSSAKWVDMGSEKDFAGETVTTQLSHFSTYAGGKAGW